MKRVRFVRTSGTYQEQEKRALEIARRVDQAIAKEIANPSSPLCGAVRFGEEVDLTACEDQEGAREVLHKLIWEAGT